MPLFSVHQMKAMLGLFLRYFCTCEFMYTEPAKDAHMEKSIAFDVTSLQKC